MNSPLLSETFSLIISDATHTLQASAGEIILLTGEVGSGKTLWLKRLAGLIELPEGISAFIDGKAPGKETGSVKMLFDHQPPLWLGQHVIEELCFGLKGKADQKKISKTLADWHLEGVEPESSVGKLNRLQAVRLSLAAMSLAMPKVALLDNPSDGLPEADATALRDAVVAWAVRSNTTVVVAANRWHDWQPAASQTWMVSAAESLPQHGRQA